MTAETGMVRLSTPRLTLVMLDLTAVEAALRRDNAALGQLLGGTVTPAWPDDQLRDAALPTLRDRLLVDPGSARYGTWAAVFAGEAIGAVGFKGRPDARGAVDLGYGLAPPWRGHGLAAEASSALIDHARLDPAIRRITADCRPRNLASIRVLERIGMTRIDERDDLICWELDLR